MLADMNRISQALKNIKHTNKCLKNWKKALNAGKKTQAEYDQVLISAQKILHDNFAMACEAGMAIGQNDELDWEERSELHAIDIIENI
jgi:hypothetical protein